MYVCQDIESTRSEVLKNHNQHILKMICLVYETKGTITPQVTGNIFMESDFVGHYVKLELIYVVFGCFNHLNLFRIDTYFTFYVGMYLCI